MASGYAENEEDLIQFSGIVINETGIPLEGAHILVLNNYKGTITDERGLFSFITHPLDTILFSSVGFKKKSYIIPDTIDEKHLNTVIVMDTDTIMIDEVKIFPWKTYQEFKRAFAELEIEDRDLKNALHNIALLRTQIILETSADPGLNFQYVMNEQYQQIMNYGLEPTTQLLNPIAWAKFFQAIKNGDFKDQNKEIRKKYGGN